MRSMPVKPWVLLLLHAAGAQSTLPTRAFVYPLERWDSVDDTAWTQEAPPERPAGTGRGYVHVGQVWYVPAFAEDVEGMRPLSLNAAPQRPRHIASPGSELGPCYERSALFRLPVHAGLRPVHRYWVPASPPEPSYRTRLLSPFENRTPAAEGWSEDPRVARPLGFAWPRFGRWDFGSREDDLVTMRVEYAWHRGVAGFVEAALHPGCGGAVWQLSWRPPGPGRITHQFVNHYDFGRQIQTSTFLGPDGVRHDRCAVFLSLTQGGGCRMGRNGRQLIGTWAGAPALLNGSPLLSLTCDPVHRRIGAVSVPLEYDPELQTGARSLDWSKAPAEPSGRRFDFVNDHERGWPHGNPGLILYPRSRTGLELDFSMLVDHGRAILVCRTTSSSDAAGLRTTIEVPMVHVAFGYRFARRWNGPEGRGETLGTDLAAKPGREVQTFTAVDFDGVFGVLTSDAAGHAAIGIYGGRPAAGGAIDRVDFGGHASPDETPEQRDAPTAYSTAVVQAIRDLGVADGADRRFVTYLLCGTAQEVLENMTWLYRNGFR